LDVGSKQGWARGSRQWAIGKKMAASVLRKFVGNFEGGVTFIGVTMKKELAPSKEDFYDRSDSFQT